MKKNNITAIMAIVFLSFFLLLVLSSKCLAIDVLLSWDGISDPDLMGYRVFIRTASGSYDYNDPIVDTGVSETEAWINNLQDAEYAFVVRAYDVIGLESADSNEVGPVLLSDLCEIIPSPPHSTGGCMIVGIRNCP
jgi:hypothetical protein